MDTIDVKYYERFPSVLRYKAGILGYSMAEMEASCLLPIPIPKK